jgi:hypothetical protein
MKTRKLNRAGITALTLALILAACDNLTGPGAKHSGETIPEGMGMVRIQLNAGESAQSIRTAHPEIGTYFTLTFTAPGKTPVVENVSGSPVTVALETGDWTLEVKGYADSARTNPRATGRASVSVTAEMTSPVTVYLTPDFSSAGTGSLSYSIILPNSVSRAWFALYPLDATGASREIDISAGAGGTVSATLNDLPVGSYRAVIDLYDGTGTNNRAATWTGAAHIYKDLITSLTRTFTAADFVNCDPIIGASATTLTAKLDAALASSGSYTIVLDGTESDLGSFAPKTLNVTGSKSIITIRGNGRTIQLGSNGSLFTLDPGSGSHIELVLQDVILRGRNSISNGSDNNAPLVWVESGETLEMKTGSSITGNVNSSSSNYGGGVYVAGNGTFTMSGGTVSNNSASPSSTIYGSGGGVYVASGGTFKINGGAVSGNSASSSSSNSFGGGVFINSGTFDMNGGTVSGNSAVTTSSSSSSSSGGGGVSISGGTFTMRGGAVSGNSVTASNSSSYCFGGGVYVSTTGRFTMSGGVISGNSAATTASNPSYCYGGGVFVYEPGTFNQQTASILYGSTESDSALKNTARSDGDAVYVYVNDSTGRKRTTTAGTEITLNSSQSGITNGWEESVITGITYSSVSGGTWTLQSDGRRKSPAIGDNSTTKTRVSFTSSGTNANIRIALDVSSESGYDFAFISTLDNASATHSSGYYTGSLISGTTSVTINIPVPTAGSHFIEIGYRKDGSQSHNSDCAWFKVIE